MEKADLKRLILEKFPTDVIELEGDGELTLKVEKGKLTEVSALLKNDAALGFDSLMCLTAVDAGEAGFGLIYHLFSMENRHKLTLKVRLDRDAPEVESVSSIWKTADWHEREVFDLFGIRFLNHPDLRRILLPDDWTAHPLRKDFVSNKVVKKPEYA